jgi:hypothetical protein
MDRWLIRRAEILALKPAICIWARLGHNVCV